MSLQICECGGTFVPGGDLRYPTLGAKSVRQGWGTHTYGLPGQTIPDERLLGCDFALSFAGLVGYLQVVLHAEDAGDSIGAHVSHLLVGLAVDDAVELDIAILHRNANGLGGIDGVLVKSG